MEEYRRWSLLANRVGNLGAASRPQEDIYRFVVHITGTSTYANALKEGVPSLKRLWDYFKSPAAKGCFSHYAIDPWGEIWQMAPDDRQPASQSLGGKGAPEIRGKITRGELRVPLWWLETWGSVGVGYVEPTQLLQKGEVSPNQHALSVECIQWQSSYRDYAAGRRNYLLTAAQYVALHSLLVERLAVHKLPWVAESVLGHEDLNPWTRGEKSGGWDPGALRKKPRFCWHCARTLDFQHGVSNGPFCPIVLPTPPR